MYSYMDAHLCIYHTHTSIKSWKFVLGIEVRWNRTPISFFLLFFLKEKKKRTKTHVSIRKSKEESLFIITLTWWKIRFSGEKKSKMVIWKYDHWPTVTFSFTQKRRGEKKKEGRGGVEGASEGERERFDTLIYKTTTQANRRFPRRRRNSKYAFSPNLTKACHGRRDPDRWLLIGLPDAVEPFELKKKTSPI